MASMFTIMANPLTILTSRFKSSGKTKNCSTQFSPVDCVFHVVNGNYRADENFAHGRNVVCYVGTWATYRPGRGQFDVGDIDTKLCSHLIYSFVGLDNTTYTVRSIDKYYDLEDDYGKGSFKKYVQLKKDSPKLKVLLAIGGWNEGSADYSKMAADPMKRLTFVTSAVEYAAKYGFDGIDVDWEFPTERGGIPEDRHNFVMLLKEFKRALIKRKLMLTVALNASKRVIDKAYDIPEISKTVDLIHLMTYDFHGIWEKRIGPNSPLQSADSLDVEASVEYIIRIGANPDKVIVGIPAYGHTFLTDASTKPKMYGHGVIGGFKGPLTGQDGFMGYNEICAELKGENGWETHWDEKSKTPYATKDNKLIAYDNITSVEEKVKLALRYKVGGFLVWSIDTDDFRGDCLQGNHPEIMDSNHKFPILRAIHRTIINEDANEYYLMGSSQETSPKTFIILIALTVSLFCTL